MVGNSPSAIAVVSDVDLIRSQPSFRRRGGDAGDHQFPRAVESGCDAAIHHGVGAQRARLHGREYRRHRGEVGLYCGHEPWRLADTAAEHDEIGVDHRDDSAHCLGNQQRFLRDDRGGRAVAMRCGAEHLLSRARIDYARPGGCPHHRCSRGRSLETAALASVLEIGAMTLRERHVADLAGGAVRATMQLAAEDQAHAQAGADRDKGEAVDVAAVPVGSGCFMIVASPFAQKTPVASAAMAPGLVWAVAMTVFVPPATGMLLTVPVIISVQ